ncbi:MAG: hypothetical protein AB7F75_00055 [Planctomycetota bacterium]
MRSRHRGFILVIVVAVLGVLATLAVQFAQKATEARILSNMNVAISRLRLMCRSGLEFGMAKQVDRICGHPGKPAAVNSYAIVLDPPEGVDVTRVMIRDYSGCINPNDGVKAGILELGGGYLSNQVDPWPTGNVTTPWPVNQADVDNPTTISGMINLRLRAILNAYGDAHRYVSSPNLGWPGSTGHVPNTPFTFTSTESGRRGVSAPAKDSLNTVLVGNANIAQSSTGLGDRILASRPANGYTSLSQVEPLINAWGEDHLDPSYLGSGTFFDKVSDDFALGTFEDDRFFRLREEHGKFESDYTKAAAKRSQILDRRFLDSNPPDFTNKQKFLRHSVALINLNSASDLVRAAVFYAPSNVSYLCEGTALDNARPEGKFVAIKSGRDWIGVGGPSFKPELMTENGIAVPANVQPDRLMSLTDAMKLASLYGKQATPPVSFPQFGQWLAKIRKDASISYERANPRTFGGLRLPYITPANTHPSNPALNPAWFTPEYVEQTLPHIFSCVRRLPGYMGAPASLLSPYIQQGENKVLWPHQTFQGPALRSVEDFVFRAHLPKVAFVPHGTLRIRIQSVLTQGSRKLENSLTTELVLNDTKILRTQEDFENHTVQAETDPDILIGPEPRERGAAAPFPVPPSTRLGVVGLRDRCEEYPVDSTGEARLAMDFDGNLSQANGSNSNLLPTDSLNDPYIQQPVKEQPPTDDGYPALRANDPDRDKWEVVKSKLDTLRNSDKIDGTTWRYPPIGRDLRYELYIMEAQFMDPDANPKDISPDKLDDFFTRFDGRFVDIKGNTLKLTTNATSDLDELSYNVTCVFLPTDVTDPPGLADSRSIFMEKIWEMWATKGVNMDVNWSHGPPRAGDVELVQSNLEGKDVSLFLPASTGSDLSPFGGIMFSSRGHGVGAAKRFNDSFYLRPMSLFPGPPSGYTVAPKFSRGYVSMWVRMPSGYHCDNTRRALCQLTLWDRSQVCVPPSSFTGGGADQLESELRGVTSYSPIYRPSSFSLYLESDTSPAGTGEALYSVVAKHQRDVAMKKYIQFQVDSMDDLPHDPDMGIPQEPHSESIYLSQTAAGLILGPSTQYGYPDDLLVPNPVGYTTPNDYTKLWATYMGYLNRYSHGQADQNANVSKELLEGPYANLPGSWRRVVCRWDLRIAPHPSNPERLSVVSEPHLLGVNSVSWLSPVSRLRTASLLPKSTHSEKARPYHGVCDGNPGMIWTFGELATCLDPIIEHPPGFGDGAMGHAGVWEAYKPIEHAHFNSSFGELQALRNLYPEVPNTYPLIQNGETYPMMRLNSSIDNIVIRMGETAGPSIPPKPSQPNVEAWVESYAGTQSRRYNVDATALPPKEPKWTLDPRLPKGSRILYVGARIYDLPYNIDAHDAGIMPPWQVPRVDFEILDQGTPVVINDDDKACASYKGHVHSSPALRHPLQPARTGDTTRLRLLYKAEDANGHSLDADGDNWNFSDIPWIEEVSWSYIPGQPRFTLFRWGE